MPKHRLKVTQIFRVEKWITLEAEADSLADALAVFASGDAPCSSLSGWADLWDLQTEVVEEACEGRLDPTACHSTERRGGGGAGVAA